MFIASIPAPPPVVQWECKDCTAQEKFVLREVQMRTDITDKYALATILGNIQQESRFNSNICEGGSRVPYHRCYSGGYGIIQWTTENRYAGLGTFARKYKCDPSYLNCQVRYMISEKQFQTALSKFTQNGRSVRYYMKAAYSWLGWGVEGSRVNYTWEFANKLTGTKG